MADDDTTDTDTEHPDDAEGVDHDPARPMARVVQLERPRSSRRRRGSAAASTTHPDARVTDGASAGPALAEASGDGGGGGGDRWTVSGGSDGPDGTGVDDEADGPAGDGEPLGERSGTGGSGAGSGGATLATLRGRRRRRRSPGIGGANATDGDDDGTADPLTDDGTDTDGSGRRSGGGSGNGDGDRGDGGDGVDGGGPGGPGADGVAQLHPRMRSRRIAVRRMEGLRRLRRLTWGLAGLALIVDSIALAHTGFVDVDTFDVVGSTHTSAVAIEHASGIHEGDALLTLDESGAERRIEALPWVAEADVVRQWPGTVRISVTERQPTAVLQVSDDPAAPLALVDATGRILDVGAHPEGLIAVTQVPPHLVEGGRVPAAARDALRIAAAASQRMPGTVVSLTVGLEATLGSGGVVRFGTVRDLDDKLMALSTVLARVDLECLGTLNLAVADHPALTRDC